MLNIVSIKVPTMRLLSLLFAVASLSSTVFGDELTSDVHENTLEDYRSVTIYDSTSRDYPLELRERGILTYSVANRSGTFSESGVLSRPHDGATHVYRIGTEDIMSAVFKPLDIIGDDDGADETLKVHIDSHGEIFHSSYFLSKATKAPGTFTVVIDHMDDHLGPEVILNERKPKSGGVRPSQKVSTDATGQPISEEEDEEEVPEKTFLQKYWIYAIPLLLVLVLGGGGEQS